MLRRPRDPRDPHAIDEGTDTYDTIDWLLKNVPHNNGRVGLLGISYGGWLTVMAMLEPHPALKAVSEQASPADMFLGDDFHHNGAFRLSYGFEYAAMMETGKTSSPFHFDRDDTFDWYLALGPLANANARYLHGNMPTWNDFATHPNYDEFWRRQAVSALPEDGHGPRSQRRGLVGPGGFLTGRRRFMRLWRSTTRGAGITSWPVLGTMADGRAAPGSSLGKIRLWQRNRQILSREDPGGVVCLLAEGRGTAAFRESHDLRDGNQRMGDLRRVAAAAGHPDAQAVFPGGGRPFLRSATGPARRISTAMSLTPRTPCPTAISRSSPPTPAAAVGRRGWWKISGSSRNGPTF